jgi:hypothetical protein
VENFPSRFDRVARGSQLSPVITNIFTEDFEERATQQVTLRPLCWFWYMGNTFVIWPHGPQVLVPPEWPTWEHPVHQGDTKIKLPSFSQH